MKIALSFALHYLKLFVYVVSFTVCDKSMQAGAGGGGRGGIQSSFSLLSDYSRINYKKSPRFLAIQLQFYRALFFSPTFLF